MSICCSKRLEDNKMIDINIKYQASVFAHLNEITPTTDNTMKLLNAFKDYGYLPGTFQEIGPSGPSPVLRLRFSSTDKEWNINIATHRIDIDRNFIGGLNTDFDNIVNFTNTASKIFEIIFKVFPRKGYRISLNTNSLIKEMEPERLESIYKKLTKPIKFYDSNNPKEWNIRSVSKNNYDVSGLDESFNIITNVGRVQGQLVKDNNINEFDRISIDFDINTSGISKDTRFEKSHMESFYNNAIHIRETILADIERAIE